MPAPGAADTMDAMLNRMRQATPGGPVWPERVQRHVSEQSVPLFDEAQAFGRAIRGTTGVRLSLDDTKRTVLRVGGNTVGVFEPPAAGGVLAACLRETANDTWAVVEKAVMPYSNVGSFGITPRNRWREGAGSAPFEVVGAVAKAIDSREISETEIEAAMQMLPGVGRELVVAALEEARAARAGLG